MFDNLNVFETILSGLTLATGFVAIVGFPALVPLGVIAVIVGACGLVMGHW